MRAFSPAPARPPQRRGRRRARRSTRAGRGFTLVELIVVVTIISILAAIALPGMARRLTDRRARKSTETIVTLYRNARMQALGRGSAMLVRFDASKTPAFEVREAINGTTRNPSGDAGCATLPVASCVNTVWSAADSRQVTSFEATNAGDFTLALNHLVSGATTAATYYEVCFTPLGRTYSRAASNVAFAPMSSGIQVQVAHADGIGLTRNVSVPPNGIARVIAE